MSEEPEVYKDSCCVPWWKQSLFGRDSKFTEPRFVGAGSTHFQNGLLGAHSKQGFLLLFIAKLYLTLCDPMDCNMLGLPVPYHLLEFVQAHFYWISDAIQPSHPLLPSPFAFNLSQHQSLFQWVSFLHHMVNTKAHWFSVYTISWRMGLPSHRLPSSIWCFSCTFKRLSYCSIRPATSV